MQIKQQSLSQQLQKKLVPIYVLIGQDNYLLNEAVLSIKSFIKKSYSVDETKYSIQSPHDWHKIIEEANSYSLFSEAVILDVYMDKKSIDSEGKKRLSAYLGAINTRCYLIIQAPHLQARNIQWLSTHEQVVVVLSYPLNTESMKSWITAQLRKNTIQFDPEIPDLIYQYTQGNMLASAQAIEKIALCNLPDNRLNRQQTLEQLSDQSDHSLYDLVDALLTSQADKAIHVLRKAAQDKTEPTLVLWMLTQEVRILLHLSILTQQNVEFKSACSQLKIWPQRTSLYHASLRKFNQVVLHRLLHCCQLIDEHIKLYSSPIVWHSLESLALSICVGKVVGDL